jgi:hypothetical protein
VADNPYLALLDQDDQHALATANLAATNGVSADHALMGIDGKALDIPEGVGMHAPDVVGPALQDQEQQQHLESSPHVRHWAATAEPAHLAVTKDDFGPLAKIGQYMGKVIGNPLQDIWHAYKTSEDFVKENERAFAQNPSFQSAFNVLQGTLGQFSAPIAPLNQYIKRAIENDSGVVLRDVYRGPDGRMVPGQVLTSPEDRARRAQDWADLATFMILGTGTKAPGMPKGRPPPAASPFAPRLPAPGSEPPPAPTRTEIAGLIAEHDAAGVAEVQGQIAESKTQQRSPQVMESYLAQQTGGQTVAVDPETVLKLAQKGHNPFPEHASEMIQAARDGEVVEIPLERYLARTAGQPFAETLNATTVFREGGTSVEEAKAEPRPPEPVKPEEDEFGVEPDDIELYDGHGLSEPEVAEAQTLAADSHAAIESVAKEQRLRELFKEPEAVDSTKSNFAIYNQGIENAIAKAKDKALAKAVSQLKRERLPDFKAALLQNTALVEQDFFNRPDVQLAHYLIHGEHPNGAPLAGPFKLDREAVEAAIGPERTARLPDSIFAKVNPNAPAAETIKGKPGVNAQRLAKMLGPQLYGDTSKIGHITLKEVLQNSFDAVSASIQGGMKERGRIRIDNRYDDNALIFTDNGTGMSPELLGGKFLQIAGTQKGENAAGGFGIAKMLFLYGNDALDVWTMKDGVASHLNTTGPALFEALEEGGAQPDIEVYRGDQIPDRVHDWFPEGHGTRVWLKIPKSYKNSRGEESTIYLPDYGDDALAHSPLFKNIDVEWGGYKTIPIGANFPIKDYTQFVSVSSNDWDMRVYISKDREKQWGSNLHVLSNGLWQFSDKITEDPMDMWSKSLPYTMYVDVRAKVRPEDSGYPFNFNRQEFIPAVKKQFDQIKAYIQALYGHKNLADEARGFAKVQYLRTGIDGRITVTEPEEMTPEVPVADAFTGAFKEGSKATVVDGKLMIDGKELPALSPDKLKEFLPKSTELKVDQSRINPNRVMYHSNLSIPGQVEDITDYLADRFGRDRVLRFYNLVGQAFMTLRDQVAKVDDYEELREAAIGISLDKAFRGVSVMIPFRGKFINPLFPESSDPDEQAYGILGTMVHELAHYKVRSHNAQFPAEMQRIEYRLRADKVFNYVEFQREFAEEYGHYSDIVAAVRELESNLDARGVGLEDSAKFEATDESDGGPAGILGGQRASGAQRSDAGAGEGDSGLPDTGSVYGSREVRAGLTPEEVAATFGYHSVDQMFADLERMLDAMKATGIKNPKEYVRKLVAAQAKNLTRNQLGYDTDPEAIRREASELLATPQIADYLADDLKDFAKENGLPFDKAALVRYATERFESRRVTTAIDIKKIEGWLIRDGKRLEAALLKGDIPAAFKWKQAQYLHQLELIQAHKFAKQYAKTNRMVKRVTKRRSFKNVDQEYLDQLHAMLLQFGIPVKRDPAELVRSLNGVDLPTFVQEMQDQGEPAVYHDLPYGVPLHKLTVDEFNKFDEVFRSLITLGQFAKHVSVMGERMRLENAIQNAINGAAGLPDKPMNREAGGRQRKQLVPKAHAFARIDAAHSILESLFEFMDNGDINGIHHRLLMDGATDAANMADRLQDEIYRPIVDKYTAIPDKIKRNYGAQIANDVLLDPRDGVPITLRRGDILPILLNMGTDSNVTKLAAGYGAEAQKILDLVNTHITKEEAEFVQFVWDQLTEKLFPKADRNARKLKGYGLTKEEATPVNLKVGKLKGGYFPIVYDQMLTPATPTGKVEFIKPFRTLTTPTGFEKERTAYTGPLLLSMDRVLRDHLRDVIIRVSYGDYAISARRFIKDARIRNLWVQKLGVEYYNELMPWLQRQVLDPTITDVDNSILRKLRLNMTVAYMGGKWSVGIGQMQGAIPVASEIGMRWMLDGYFAFMHDVLTGKANANLYSKSEEMYFRHQNLEQNVRDYHHDLAAMDFNRSPMAVFKEKVASKTMQYINWMDKYTVSGAAWMGAYRKAKFALRMSEGDARRYADKVVRKTQGTAVGPRTCLRFREGADRVPADSRLRLHLAGEAVQSAKGGDSGPAGWAASWPGLAKSWWLFFVVPVVAAVPSTATGRRTGSRRPCWRGCLRRVTLGWLGNSIWTRDAANYLNRTMAGGHGNYRRDYALTRLLDQIFRVVRYDKRHGLHLAESQH